MIGDREISHSSEPQTVHAGGNDLGIQALYQAAGRLADARRGAPRFKTRDLVGLLLSHGARTWRNSQPHVTVRVRAVSPDGRPAVRMALR